MKVPVLVLAFNRADHVAEAMKAIQEYKPDRLYLECDGARPHKEGEVEAVEQTRQTMLNAITWDCEVKTLFREENLGCAKAVYGAISWFFEHEEWGVIIEDDIIVSQDFFKLCEDLLPRYKDQERIMEISARNHRPRKELANTYMFSDGFYIWGWATWRRAWQQMDMSMAKWKDISILQLWRKFGFVKGSMMYHYWDDCYKHSDTHSSWGTRWYFCVSECDGLVLTPGVNLALNIGMQSDGAHYSKNDQDPYFYLTMQSIEWPLIYNDDAHFDKEQLRRERQDFSYIRKIGAKKKIARLLHI